MIYNISFIITGLGTWFRKPVMNSMFLCSCTEHITETATKTKILRNFNKTLTKVVEFKNPLTNLSYLPYTLYLL